MLTKYADYLESSGNQIAPWNAGLYIRLSKEDLEKTRSESVSVANQREILGEYIKLHPDIRLYDTYVDDGWTGTDFERPDFTRLMGDVNSGRVNCVIVKSLDRFGRNYTKGGELIDDVFARLGVRFIALNNGVDTYNDNMNAATRCISIGVTNVINESYAAMTSVSIRGTLNCNRQQGKFIGSFPTYGYLKDPEDHHKLIVDSDAAPIVRMIYDEFIGGRSIRGIVAKLNGLGVPNPTAYKQQKGMKFKPKNNSNDGLWSDRTVRRILQNRMYAGDMVQGKNKTISYKIHECRPVPKEDWMIVENTHEPIIEREAFDRVQSLFKRGIRHSPVSQQTDLFAGLVRCADCGKIMCKKTNRQNGKEYQYYRCSTWHKKQKSACTSHTIRIDKLEEAVLQYLQMMVSLVMEYDEAVRRIKQSQAQHQNDSTAERALKAQLDERDKCRQMMQDLYPDWKRGMISQNEYLNLRESISERIAKLDEIIDKLEAAASNMDNPTSPHNELAAYFIQHQTINKLTRPMLLELIDTIYIHEGSRITVKMRCMDAFEHLISHLEEDQNDNEPINSGVIAG